MRERDAFLYQILITLETRERGVYKIYTLLLRGVIRETFEKESRLILGEATLERPNKERSKKTQRNISTAKRLY